MHPRPVRRIVLVEPRSPDVHIFSRFHIPRIGVVLLGTILKELGYQVSVLVESIGSLDEALLFSADLVGISVITPTAMRSYELADRVRARGIPVVLGGPHPTHRPDEALARADYVIRGEAEASLPALVHALQANGPERESLLAEVAGLSWAVGGTNRHNPIAPLEADLDRWPDPDLSLVTGLEKSKGLKGRRLVPILTSRGCPYDCVFCSVTPTFGRTMRYRSIARLRAEMVKFEPDTTHFFFYDDNFTASPARARDLLAMLRTLPGRPTYSAQVRVDVARDEALLAEMRAVGFETVYVGLESVNQASLVAANKRQEIEEVALHLERLRVSGIHVHGMFIFGFDTDTPQTVEHTVAFARRHRIRSVQFLLLTPLPGSRWAQEMEATGRMLTRDWSRFDCHHVTFWPANLTPSDLQAQQMDGHEIFYSWGEVLRRLWRREWVAAGVVVYARHINRVWKRHNRAYLAEMETLSRPATAA